MSSLLETGEITLTGVTASQGRLDVVFDLIEQRRAELDREAGDDELARKIARYAGPAFRVIIDASRLDGLLGDDGCRAHIEHVARHGDRCGVVILIVGGDLGDVARSLTCSRTLTAALMSGKGVKHVEPTGPALHGGARSEAERAVELLLAAGRQLTGVEPAALVDALRSAIGDDAPESRASLSAALRATADLIGGVE